MCGIAGIMYKHGTVPENTDHKHVLNLLKHRGPDNQACQRFPQAVVYHSRLQIIDTTQASNQPFSQGNHSLVFNGELFNYKTLQKNFSDIQTNGDVEVLFKSLEQQGKNCLNGFNGFFAFGFYNQQTHSLLVARDRFGVKPLYYYNDDEKFAFASEIKPLVALVGKQPINNNQLYSYFRLNYSAGPETILANIFRLQPGECIEVSSRSFNHNTWYHAPANENKTSLRELLNDAVKLRLQADVPVGTFLSGGLDSSIISALAKKHKPDLHTFSLGFENEGYFDETVYSEMVARHIDSRHHVFKLKEDDFIENIHRFLTSIDEPFADSSAFNFYLLSKFTQQHVKVALSGDGADELFKGYNKHRALLLSEKATHRWFAGVVSGMFAKATGSRHGYFNNKIRQLNKFNQLAGLSTVDKQKFLACISDNSDCLALLKSAHGKAYFDSLFKSSASFTSFALEDSFDIQTVLTDDMLVKADRFSMQHGIEIRNPFLDYRVVEFALNLEKEQKISTQGQKLILKNSFADLLPPQIFNRRKKGFELPLQKWLSNNLRSTIESNWLNTEKLEAEGYLNVARVMAIKNKAFSANAGDAAAKLWAILVFENWLETSNTVKPA